MSQRAGRRPGGANTRQEIVDAAGKVFDELGFNGASIRGIAQRAGVDPALVHHYFTDKAQLFVEARGLPRDPRRVAEEAAAPTGSFDGRRVVERFLEQWERGEEGPGSRSFLAAVQAMAASPAAADAMREFLLERLAVVLGDGEGPRWRQALVSSQLVGLGWARYVMRFEPLASASRQEVADLVGPTLDRYVTNGE